MGEVKCSPGPWKAIENSWQYTTIYDAHDREICRLDLERFEDLNEETQDKYEAIQRADAAAIVLACDHDAALRRAKAEGLDDAAKAICMYCNDPEWQKRDEDDNHESPYTRTMYPCAAYKIHDLIRKLDARAAQIEEGEDLK